MKIYYLINKTSQFQLKNPDWIYRERLPQSLQCQDHPERLQIGLGGSPRFRPGRKVNTDGAAWLIVFWMMIVWRPTCSAPSPFRSWPLRLTRVGLFWTGRILTGFTRNNRWCCCAVRLQYDEVIPGRCLDGVKMSDVKIYCSYEKKLLRHEAVLSNGITDGWWVMSWSKSGEKTFCFY